MSTEDIGCCVCGDTDEYADNDIVFCDGCNVAVHQLCYGIMKVPKGSWYCDPCKAGLEVTTGLAQQLTCALCSFTGGAYKKLVETWPDGQARWVHQQCAVFTPEVGFGAHSPAAQWQKWIRNGLR